MIKCIWVAGSNPPLQVVVDLIKRLLLYKPEKRLGGPEAGGAGHGAQGRGHRAQGRGQGAGGTGHGAWGMASWPLCIP